jgi:hypothetical protein
MPSRIRVVDDDAAFLRRLRRAAAKVGRISPARLAAFADNEPHPLVSGGHDRDTAEGDDRRRSR